MSTMDISQITWRKSSHSHGNGGECVEVGVWRKSSHSHGNGGDCVEVATAAPGTSTLLLMRDSKDPSGPKLTFTDPEWTAFLTQIKTGHLDHAI